MEPIRPDDDELRADAPIGSGASKKTAGPRAAPAQGGGHGGSTSSNASKRRGGGNGRGGLSVLWMLVIAFACAAVAGWYSQNQRIQALESQLEEADYWARQSKLALARFEGELSETGENLQERGASLAEQISANAKALASTNSEIRKLWVVANERNKARLNEHQERLQTAEKSLDEAGRGRAALEASLAQAKSSFGADLSALKEQTQTSIVTLREKSQQATDQLARVTQQLAEVDQLIEGRLRRFEQEQKLGISGMEGRIRALESEIDSAASDSRVGALQRDLAGLKETLNSIDASRAQLTSRLVRLSEEVNALRDQQSSKQ